VAQSHVAVNGIQRTRVTEASTYDRSLDTTRTKWEMGDFTGPEWVISFCSALQNSKNI
jgi:hypothetical protein